MAGTNPSLGVYSVNGKTLPCSNVCEDKSRRTIAKSYFPFIDNSLLEQCQNKRITMGKPDGFIEIEVGETFFDVLKALLARTLSSLLQVFKIVLQIMYFLYRLTF